MVFRLFLEANMMWSKSIEKSIQILSDFGIVSGRALGRQKVPNQMSGGRELTATVGGPYY